MEILKILLLLGLINQEPNLDFRSEAPTPEFPPTSLGSAGDSIAVAEFEAIDVTADVAYSVANTIRTELGKQVPVFSIEDLKQKGIRPGKTVDKMIELCKTQNIPILISGKVKKSMNRYLIKVIYLNFLQNKGDTLITVTSSPIVTARDIANLLLRQATGETENEFGSVQFVTYPTGADVLLDGEFVGVTPVKIDLVRFGEHSVLFSKRGYTTAVKLIVVYPERTTNISLSLTPISGSLIAPPEKAPVYLVDEIVVRGEKIRDELFKVPKGIEILNARDIEYSGAKNVPELLSQIPGVSVVDKTGSGVSTSISIRGMEPTKYTLVTLDGIVINRIDGEVNWGAIPLEIIKRIEVIKGGATTPYGGKAVGGVINIVTKEKERNKISLSSTNGKDAGWAATLSSSDGWDIWVNTHGRRGSGWRDEENYDIRTFYGKFTFPLHEKSSAVFSIDAANQKNYFPGGLTESQLSENAKQSGDDKENKQWENIRFTSQYEAKSPDSKLLFKFHTIPQDYRAEGLINKWLLKGVEVGTSVEYGRKNWTFLIQGELTNLGRKMSAVFPETTICDENSQSFVFRSLLEWQEKLFKIFTLTPGVKFEYIGYTIRDNKLLPSSPKNFDIQNLSPKFGLIWTSMPCDIFSSIERTIYTPKPYEKAKNIELKPEMITSMEVGTRLRRRAFSGSISLFYIDLQDQILMKGTTFENSRDGVFHRGAEGEVNLRLTENLALFLNHTYINAKFKKSKLLVPQIPCSESKAGVRITYMPTYSLIITYKWYGKSYADTKHQTEWIVNPYGLLDFYFKFKPHPSFSVGLSVTNFTNEQGKSFGYEYQGEARYYPITPRGFRIEGSFEF